MCACIAPITDEEVQKARLEAYLKEINIMDTEPHFANFDFRCFFGDYDRPLHSTMQPNPNSARSVHESIQLWISRHSAPSKIHFPSMSNKLLPRFTRQDIDVYMDVLLQDPSVATQGSLEYLWMKYGVEFSGPCEIKQRWYTNKLTPRTYYVCGPELYNSCKYTKDLWNDLADCLVVTQRRNRVNPRRIHIEGIEKALFYDLSSFTSNCATQREFLAALAIHVDGLPFNILDTRNGPNQVDFGDIVRDYCNTNIHPQYASSDASYRGVHGVAGFLGVYGNIATCTFIHGAFLLQLASDKSKCGCAGDDAVIVTVEEDSTIWLCVTLMGVLAREKVFSSEDPDVVYLKRRTWRDDHFCRLESASYVQIPSFLFKMPKHEMMRFRENQMTYREKKILACNSLESFFRSVVPFYDTDFFLDISRFAREYYALLGIPTTGNVPQFSRFMGHGWERVFIPAIDNIGIYDFISNTIKSSYPGFCFLDERSDLSIVYPLTLRKDGIIKVYPGKEVSLLQKMGILEELRSGVRLHEGIEGLEALLDTYSGKASESAKRFRVIQDISDVPFPPEVFGVYDSDYEIRLAFEATGELGPENTVALLFLLCGACYSSLPVFIHRKQTCLMMAGIPMSTCTTSI